MTSFKKELLKLDENTISFYSLPVLYKGSKANICILEEKIQITDQLLNSFFSKDYYLVILFNQSHKKNSAYFEKTIINLKKVNINKSDELNLFYSINQFDYKLKGLFNQKTNFFELNLDNNFIWGIKNKKTLNVYGMIINRPRTFSELIESIKYHQISDLIFFWNNNNQYKQLFNSYKLIKTYSFSAHYNSSIYTNSYQLNLMFPFFETHEKPS